MSVAQPADRTGIAYGFAAYTIWGLLPLYIRLLQPASAAEIVAHRAIWAVLLLAGLAVALRRLGGILNALRRRDVALALLASTLLISANWLVYTWGVANHHVLETSLGYFINPLVNVALGMLFLRERLNRAQMAAVMLACAGVIVMAVAQGGALWISLALALSFGLYGLIRKVVAIDPLGGLLIETALIAPVALGYVLWLSRLGEGTFGQDPMLDVLLAGSGLLTVVPLLMFAAAARRLRYSTLGLIQYVAPTLQFLLAITVFGERMTAVHLVTFGLIWTGLALFALDGLRAARAAPVVAPE